MKTTIAIAVLCIILASNPIEDIAMDVASEQISLLRVAAFESFPGEYSKAYMLDLRASGIIIVTHAELNLMSFVGFSSPDPGYYSKLIARRDEMGWIPASSVIRIISQTIIELTDEEFKHIGGLIISAYECEPVNLNLMVTFSPPDAVYMVINDKAYFFDYYSHGFESSLRSYTADKRTADLYKALCILSGFNGLRHQYNYN